MIDYYDDPQPEQYWAEDFTELKQDLKLFTKIVAGPTALFAAVTVINIILDKKWKSL